MISLYTSTSKIETLLLSEGIGCRYSLACEAKDYFTEAAKRLSEDVGYREEFERLVAIARNVMRDVVGQPERHE